MNIEITISLYKAYLRSSHDARNKSNLCSTSMRSDPRGLDTALAQEDCTPLGGERRLWNDALGW